MKFKKKNIITIVLVLIIISLLIVIDTMVYSNHDNTILSGDKNATQWNGNQYIQKPTANNSTNIVIPGWDYIYLKPDCTNQKVNFFNPKTNSCLFKMLLYIENELVWESGYIEPGYGFYNIEIARPFTSGSYNGNLKIQCYERNGQPLNGAKLNFTVIIQEENYD